MLTVEQINKRISKEFCEASCNKLSYTALKDKYEATPSYKKKVLEIEETMKKVGIADSLIEAFLELYHEKLIPAGTKGTIRGNFFNKIVKEEITNMKLDKERFIIEFEKNNSNIKTDEIPDWCITDNKTGKTIIGMNQLDLWNGGQQSNRGLKYLLDNKINTKNSKLLCVVCNKTTIAKKGGKRYTIFNTGFQKDTLCYIQNLKNIIHNFFDS